MKTSEFIKRIEEFGYEVVHQRDEIQAWENEYDLRPKVRIQKSKANRLILNCESYSLIKLCIEYAETPLLEREEEKKYIVILPDPNRIGKRVYALGKNLGEVIIRNTQRQGLEDSDMYHLTESEIKRNHEYLWEFRREVQE